MKKNHANGMLRKSGVFAMLAALSLGLASTAGCKPLPDDVAALLGDSAAAARINDGKADMHSRRGWIPIGR